MKNRKWVLGILLLLIIATLAFMVFVMATGSDMYKREQEYFLVLENAACDYIQDENVSPEIWKIYPEWQKIYMKTLIENHYVKEDSTNPVTQQKLKDNTKGYVKIEFKGNKVTCQYKED